MPDLKNQTPNPSPSPPPGALKLRVAAGPDFGKELVLERERGSYRIGKASDCDLVLTDRSVSGVHLTVEVVGSNVRFTDSGSTNGSFYRDARFDTVELPPPSSIRLGRTDLKLVPGPSPAPALRPSDKERFGELLGKSLVMRELFAMLEVVAPAESNVLLQSEPGAGRHLCAHAIHLGSRRATGHFEVLDVRDVPAAQLETELFGQAQSAFAGAVLPREGVFERANGGTVHLADVDALPVALQARVVGVLERREVQRAGASNPETVDVRIVASTSADLEALAKAGRFRADLLQRVGASRVAVPPLRERPEDLSLLVDHFLDQLGKPAAALSPSTRALLRDYTWPGNVRELKALATQAANLGAVTGMAVKRAAEGRAPPTQSADGAPEAHPRHRAERERLLQGLEKDLLERLLKRHHGNVANAAKEAGLPVVQVEHLMAKHDLAGPRP